MPIITDIHQKILAAATQTDGSFDMDDWHTCGTTHCRGGWAIFLAGTDGQALEDATTSQFAALQIYKASSTIAVAPVRFFETNEVAMADIVRCADEEKKAQ